MLSSPPQPSPAPPALQPVLARDPNLGNVSILSTPPNSTMLPTEAMFEASDLQLRRFHKLAAESAAPFCKQNTVQQCCAFQLQLPNLESLSVLSVAFVLAQA